MSRRPAGDEVDQYVAARIRDRRKQLGLNQKVLAKLIGISHQQFQKNERATNRVGASRLYELAQALDVTVPYFFDHMPEPSRRIRTVAAVTGRPNMDVALSDGPETRELAENFLRIPSKPFRRKLLMFIRSLNELPGDLKPSRRTKKRIGI